MTDMTAAMGGAGSFENVRAFLRYVQGESCSPESIPSTIVNDLRELEMRAERIKALTGLMSPVELSPYMLSLLKSSRAEGAAPVEMDGALRAASA